MKKSSFIWFSLIVIFSALFFRDSFSAFYTNDDFFHLKISRVDNIAGFLNFFNLQTGSEGQLLYRPLTTHVFYFLAWGFFNLNSFGLHVVSFILFTVTLLFIYKIVLKLSKKENLALLTTFLYAISATHYGHLYYLATEVVLSAVFFPTVYFFINFLEKQNFKNFMLFNIFFVLSMMAKENSVALPVIFCMLFIVFSFLKRTKLNLAGFIKSMIPIAVILIVYFFMRFSFYGFVSGDSYIWDFTLPRTLNTLGWYLFWSMNMPEMFVDFIGPGVRLNPNLFEFWGDRSKTLLILFSIQTLILIFAFLKAKMFNKKHLLNFSLFALWFVVTIGPILFLPLHKFTFYLTLPLFGFTYGLAYIFNNLNNRWITTLFVLLWIATSYICLHLTKETNWISTGQKVAKNVYIYTENNKFNLEDKTIQFIDTENDVHLPFSPTTTLKNILSDNNFFDVFYEGKIKAVYGGVVDSEKYKVIESRRFLGY